MGSPDNTNDVSFTDKECTCPPPPEHEGLGVPVPLGGKSHRRGCPVVQNIFEMQDRMAREAAEEHVQRGGILQTPAEMEARQANRRSAELARRVEELEAEVRRLKNE